MIPVPNYAKNAARSALKERNKLIDTKKFGLTVEEAKKLGINSGVARAHQLLRQDYITPQTGKSIGSFYDRFKNCKTPKCEGALKLWGGRKFGRKMANKF